MDKISPKITVIAEGPHIDGSVVESALAQLPDVKVRSQGTQRGVVGTALKWTLEFLGGSGKLAEGLVKTADNLTSGATLKLQVGEIIIEINNANRGQIPELLDKAVLAAQSATKL